MIDIEKENVINFLKRSTHIIAPKYHLSIPMRLSFLLFSVLIFSQCQTKETDRYKSQDYQMHISVDESFRPLIESTREVFKYHYKNSKIEVAYKAEDEAVEDLLSNKSKLIVISRQLNPQERAELKKKNTYLKIVPIAIDAPAFIIHPENEDSLLHLKRLEQIVRGKAKNKKGDTIVLVFDKGNSSNLNYICQYFNITAKDSLKTYVAQSNQEVIDYVAKNKNAVGVIGVNWISDVDDENQQSFLDKIRVVGIASKENTTNKEDFVQPYSANLYEKKYPFTREILAITTESNARIATSFITFLRNERGQRIVLKAGLVPVEMPHRKITVKKKIE